MERTMSKDNKKLSKLSIAGLVIAVLTPAILCLNFPLASSDIIRSYSTRQLINIICDWLAIILPVLALHLSIAGVKDAKKPEKKGVIPGVAGVVISALEIAAYVIFVVFYTLNTAFPTVY